MNAVEESEDKVRIRDNAVNTVATAYEEDLVFNTCLPFHYWHISYWHSIRHKPAYCSLTHPQSGERVAHNADGTAEDEERHVT
jgi:hypothetical protein